MAFLYLRYQGQVVYIYISAVCSPESRVSTFLGVGSFNFSSANPVVDVVATLLLRVLFVFAAPKILWSEVFDCIPVSDVSFDNYSSCLYRRNFDTVSLTG